MGKIIAIIEPAEGHFSPFIPIIKRLVQRGHEVLCITGRIFQTRIEKTGAAFQPLPPKWDFSEKEAFEFFPELKKLRGLSSIKYYLKHVMYDPVPDHLNMLMGIQEKFRADIIISDTFMVAGVWITEVTGIPSVRLSVLPLSFPGKNIPPFGLGLLPGKKFFSKLKISILKGLFEKVLFNDVQKHANKIRKKVGLPPFDKIFFIKGFEIANLVLHTSTPSFEYFYKEFPQNFRFIGPIVVPPDVEYKEPEWWPEIKKDIPIVLITQGTIAKNLDNLILPAIEALKNEKMIVLVVPVKEGEIKNLPEHIKAEPFIPFGNILPHVDLVITNGGFGGTQNALAHGIPVIIAGATEDKMEVAARLEYSGAGINLNKQKPTPVEILKAVKKVMSDPSYKQKAKELQANFSQYDAPLLAVDLMEKLIEKTR